MEEGRPPARADAMTPPSPFRLLHAVIPAGLVLVLLVIVFAPNRPREAPLRLAVFTADVTVPLNHGMMGGAWLSKRVVDPLEANGFVLLGGEAPVVFVSVDWCEIRNEAYERWQTVLAEAAGTGPDHVMVTSIHQHDAPE